MNSCIIDLIHGYYPKYNFQFKIEWEKYQFLELLIFLDQLKRFRGNIID